MSLQTAKGVQDVPPEEKLVLNKIVSILKIVFERCGFMPLETPILERYETLASKYAAGEDSDALKEVFKLNDQGERDLALRFDLTVPLARYVAMNPTLKMPFKRYEMGPVFRDGPIKAGRLRQFWQCDIDTIGSASLLADAEIISILQNAFAQLNLDVVIKINNRKLLNGILEQSGIQNKEPAIIAIDKLDKLGFSGVEAELKERGYNNKQIEKLFSFLQAGITLNQLEARLDNPEGQAGLKELKELFSYLDQWKISEAEFEVSLARGLAYYTGTVYEVYLKKGKITSSLAAGGRWDEMIGKFIGGNRLVPAVGAAFGLVPILEALKEQQTFSIKTPAQVYVVPIKTVNECLPLIKQLRQAGINTDFDLSDRGMSKNLQYANTLGIPYVLIIGDQELAENKVLFRNMQTGDQQLLSLTEVIARLK